MTILLDARDAGRGLMFAHLEIPAKPGPMTLVYPQWIPGEHGPTGPLHNLAGLRISANGSPLSWQRDLVDMYAFHVDVPAGVNALSVDFDVLMNGGVNAFASEDILATPNIAILNWHRALLYQDRTNAREVYVKPSIILPAGWDYGTALFGARRSGDRVDFTDVSLETLVDSPLDFGRYAKHITLWSSGSASSVLDIFADRPQDLDVTPEVVSHYKRMIPEALALYGARHWNVYHSLLTLSDAIPFEGIEHHQSSDDRDANEFLTKNDYQLATGDLLTHELSHSWNGKYRRPADLTTVNFQIPQQTDLLWVYEGLNQYLGDLISFRAGIRDPKLYPEFLARTYADMDSEPGRRRDPLIDTTIAAPYLYYHSGEYSSLRRTANDFYHEGELLWLDADTIIREQTSGRKSLDDFLHAYAGPPDSGPKVVTYTREDIERLLGAVAPYDWHGFFQRYVYQISEHPPTDELARSGWKLVYSAEPNVFGKANDEVDKSIDLWYSLGLRLSGDGKVKDVREASPAWNAGLAPGTRIVAINGQEFDKDIVDVALRKAEHAAALLAVLTEHDKWYRTYQIDYHGGPRYPHLVRIKDRPDMLAKIMAPHARP